ncbi:tRNA (5-methylaminomethyl-2-thiouridylate)-methyltransferase [Dethiosulfatibacter aminovorans DSM 17477]|uniref:tRNA-uridine 2-sulfurtransferase n=1 Tax=Dethiosulfatibacter aminovorans DSM 17477 TaxID=1121476 RepID=A0A1M6CWZ8_9FIRM|nr:tRNA 2-thiouridine(34) synthase MnmA [Dethiosulfatibacter aminovorans]SHI65516.1 tRNA (5-methylaminomethyl-2-thiouridylate)-methyltransferase [Dethiosulfatibacter aminovorans DSM 17477]
MVKRKVLVGLSGGLDSALSAYVLKKSGYEVKGIHLVLHDNYEAEKEKNQAIINAGKIGVELEVVELKELFEERVVNPFVELYLDGKTPNPCIYCNYHIKYGVLIEMMKNRGCDFLSLGHYAKIEFDESLNQHVLKKSKNSRKDQSYFLHGITRENLGSIILPMAEYENKEMARKEIEEIIPELGKLRESKNICSIGNRNYQAFICKKTGEKPRPGFISDECGKILGKHKGIINYTIGQKRGIKGKIHLDYVVIDINSEKNEIILGPEERLFSKEIEVGKFNIIADRFMKSGNLKVKTSQWGHETGCSIEISGRDRVVIRTKVGMRAPAIGQAAVVYMDDIVVGGGIIDKVIKG